MLMLEDAKGELAGNEQRKKKVLRSARVTNFCVYALQHRKIEYEPLSSSVPVPDL